MGRLFLRSKAKKKQSEVKNKNTNLRCLRPLLKFLFGVDCEKGIDLIRFSLLLLKIFSQLPNYILWIIPLFQYLKMPSLFYNSAWICVCVFVLFQ